MSPGRQVSDPPMPPVSQEYIHIWCQHKEATNLEELRTAGSLPLIASGREEG